MKGIFKKILLIALITVLFLNVIFWVRLFTGYKKYSNVSYGERVEEIMDIYIPRTAKKKSSNGCILFIHGGSWSGGSKEEETLRCRNYASKGYITATISYSLFSGDQSAYNVGIVMDQITAAFEKIIAVCQESGVVVGKCATSGYSAGAHLSMLYGYACKDKCPLELVFTANLAGPADMSFDVWGGTGYRISQMLTGKTVADEAAKNEEGEELAKKISPTTYVNENSVPSIFAYGQKDTTVSIANGNSIKQKFESFNLEHEYILFPHSNHPMALDLHKRMAYYKAITKYCKRYFGY